MIFENISLYLYMSKKKMSLYPALGGGERAVFLLVSQLVLLRRPPRRE